VIADNSILERVLLSLSIELQEQTLAQITRAGTGRIKRLNHFQHFENLFLGNICGGGQFLDGGLQVTMVVDVADEHLGN
jgi:hypothetical protein